MSDAHEIWIDGEPADSVPVLDRGLQYGDGVFETIGVRAGRARFLELHLARLTEGCRRLYIGPPDLQTLRREIATLVARGTDSILKLIVTRGTALERGYAASGQEIARRILLRFGVPRLGDEIPEAGLAVAVLTSRLGENPQLAGIKHLNRLEQVLARAECARLGTPEGLMCSSSGKLISGTMSNVFLVHGAALATPRLDRCGVAGVMRSVVLREARRLGIDARECDLSIDDLSAADEVFLTNVRMGVTPVNVVDGHPRAVGPVTLRLQAAVGGLDA